MSSWTLAAALLAARQQVADAKRALNSPYLVPGDREVLRMRIKHPTLTLPEVAQLFGVTSSAFGAKLRGACNRGPRSRNGLRSPDSEQWIQPGPAAQRVGVSKRDLRGMATAGTLPCRIHGNGAHQYQAGELDRVRRMLGETMVLVVDQLAARPS